MNKKLLAMVAVALLAGPMAAQAIPMRLDATTHDPTMSSWYVEFNDTGNHLFSLNELTFFSGMICTGGCSSVLDVVHFNQIVNVPPITNYTTGIGNSWVFRGEGVQLSTGTFSWSYSITSVSVPEPGTLALFGLGLAGLGFVRLRRATN